MQEDRTSWNFSKQDVVINTTLIMLMLYGSTYSFIRMPISIVCMLPLLFPSLKLSKIIWLIILLLLIFLHLPYLAQINNFSFIHIYLCLAILVCTYADNFEQSLAFNARLMLIIIFGFASLNKVFSGDYLNSSFFHFSFLTDNRFTNLLTAIHLLPKETAQYNWNEFMQMTKYAPMPYEATLRSSETITVAAKLLTWLTVALESGIAIVFLLPRRLRITKYRDYFLFTFILVTYSFANVTGFGAVIAILGLAQCDTKRKSLVYILLFLLLQVYDVGLYKAINKFW